MSHKIILLGCLLACLQPIYSKSAPFFTKCKGSDSKCIKATAQAAIPIFAKGIPELGIEIMDPLKLKKVDGGSSTLKLNLRDLTISGLSACIAKKVQLSSDQKKLLVKLQCDVEARGLYNMDGNILLLKITGDGNAHAILRKIAISVECDLKDVTGKDGKTHWSISKWNHSYKLLEKATIELDNLFNGNEELGRATNDLLKNNPNEFATEVGQPIVSAVVKSIVKNVNELFKHFEKSDLVE